MNFKALDLPYKFEEYSPWICFDIMQIHYEKHYLGYLKNLNQCINKYPEFAELSIEDILSNMDKLPEDIRTTIRNNGGGYANHTHFWEILNPICIEKPSPEFKKILLQHFESFDDLKKTLLTSATQLFGSGWAWLVVTSSCEIKVFVTQNQDSPYMYGYIPILGIDVWEHAYYLQYKNLRANYLEEVWKILDWHAVEEKYNHAINTNL